ncbi:uncharacterized protein [Spinacia oleracea]|uniref:Retrotransposon gag domain-containing protein n=1 Tax=Spinacia oleracea TaxID=3562 RepID=A0ABM3RIR4_SPIOL|nr:uncharacterized protein LOC130469982 [Spinacia oleracea]
MTTEEMTLAEMKAAYEKAQAELAQERASIENLQKELESVKSTKYQSRYKPGAKPKKLIFEMTDDSEDLTDGEEPQGEEDEATLDPVTKRLNKMENHMKKRCSLMMKLMTKLPGAPTPVETEPTDGYAASPFCEAIARVTVPHQLRLPTWTTLYDGTSDPYRHVNFYKQRMWQIGIPYDLVEPVMCKSFGGTLDGAALEWLMNITPGSIFCLSDLINAFYQQFASSRQLEKQTSDLYWLVQGPTESVRDYFNRFNCEKISIKNCDVRTAIEAFKRGLVPNSELYRELTKYPCATFEERPTGGSSDRRSYTPRNNSWRHQPYNRQNQVQNVNQYDDTNSVYRNERVVYLPISEYGFNVDIGGVVNDLQSVGGTVRWPKKRDIPDSTKDMSRWCDFHRDNGHTTEECISLKKEVAYLLKRGHLKDLLSDKGKETYNKDSNSQPNPAPSGDRPAPPTFEKVVNVISGGSDICGLTSSAAKKINRGESEAVKEGQTEDEVALDKSLAAMIITFDDSDSTDTQQEHHDGLVISLPIGNALIKRILIDNGSSANVLFLEALQEMGLDEKSIIRRSTVLVGFSGESLRTVGEISLPTYAEGTNVLTKFNVVDCPSAYNVILGRPWIHKMKAVPSTYHQSIKFPTKWGVMEIKGQQRDAKKCYETALKPSKSSI